MTRRFTLLGSLNIEEGGQPSPVMSSRKGCALLAYLIIKQQPQSREAVADLLWQSTSTSQSLARLRTLLSRIQKWVPELVITRQSLTFQQNADTTLDLYSLHKALASKAVNQIDEGLTLYQGELLSDFYVEDAPRFDEWLLLERGRLHQQIMIAYEQLCYAYAEQEDWVRGLAAAQHWLVLDELNEAALHHLLQFLAASGQIELALLQYEISRQRLWAELEVEAAPETVQLVQRLQELKNKQGGGLAWAVIVGAQVERPSPDQLAEPGALPPNAYVPFQRNNDFTGRRNSLLHLANLLLPDREGNSHRAVAVTGMGGLGKTQIAVEFCYRYGRYFPGGVFWLSFAEAENVAEEVAIVGGERGMGLYRETEKLMRIDQIGRVQRAWQEPIPRLLIFDNCEEEALLSQWLPKTGGSRVLLTSYRASWERELQVAQWPLQVLDSAESAALLQQLAPKLSPVEAAEIATELGHLPLALQLAGGFLHRYQQVDAAAYLAQLRDMGLMQHPSLKGRGTRHSPTGHDLNVSRTFAINLEQLDPANEADHVARQLLARAACFAPGEPISQSLLLATVINDEADLMAVLLAEDGLARLIALGFLEGRGSETAVIHRLLVGFTNDVLVDNMTAAQTAVEKRIIEATTDLSIGSWSLAIQQYSSIHLRYIMNQALSRQDINSARLVGLWGRYLRDIGDYENAEQKLLDAQKLQLQILGQNHPQTAETLFQLGRLYIRMGHYEQSRASYEQYLAFWERAQNPDMPNIAKVLYALGTLHTGLGDFELAQSYLKRALALRIKHLGLDHPHTGFTLINLGVLYYNIGDFETAQLTLEQALPIIAAFFGEISPDIANIYGNLGKVYLGLDNLDKAWAFSMKALDIREQALGADHSETAFSLTNLGRILMKQKKYEEALSYSERALMIREKALEKDHPHLADSYHQLGKLLLETGSQQQAVAYLKRALAIRERALDLNHPKTASIFIDLGEWYQAQGNNGVARSHYEQALAMLVETVVPTHPDIQRVQQNLSVLNA